MMLLISSALALRLLPPLVQRALDQYVTEINSYPVQYQRKKATPSGTSRDMIYFDCQRWGGYECLQTFGTQLDNIHGLLADVEQTINKDWILAELLELCERVAGQKGIDSFQINWGNVWDIFQQMIHGVKLGLE
jgi:hypothetical protein